MSVPFSNTHLRVPRGFGAVLEGLAREVLRDQPGDIPEYAARYFQALLEKREESGMDPAEWAAKLEDRFYNNEAFKTTETDPEQETAGEVTSSQEETCESQAEDKSSISTRAQHLSPAPPGVGEKAHETESEDEENNHDVTEKTAFSAETVLSEGESINRLQTTDIQSNEPSSAEKQAITALDHVDKAVNETDSSSVLWQITPELESTDLLSFRGTSNVDVCAQELGAAEDEGADKQASAVVDTESINSDEEDNDGVGKQEQTFRNSSPTDVDVCASEIGETKRAMERSSIETDTQVVKDTESVKPQPEGTVEETSLPQAEEVEGSQQEVEDQLEKTGEDEKTETEPSLEETHESLSHVEHDFDCTTLLKEVSLVEVNFEDIPEAQQLAEVVEKQPEEVSSMALIQTETLQIEQKEEPKELIPSTIHQNISDTQKCHDFELESGGKEVDSEEEKVKRLQGSIDTMEEYVVTNDPNLNYSAYESGINTENINSSDQPTTESEKEKQEREIVQEIEDNETVNEGIFHHYEESVKATMSGFKEDEKTDELDADEEEIYKESHREMEDEEINDSGAGNNSSQVTHSSTSVVPVEPESEMFEKSAQDLAEEEEVSESTLGESQPGDSEERKEATSKEAQEVNQKEINFEVNEKSAEESVSLWTAADHQDLEKPLEAEEHPTQPAGGSEDKEECSRPQEEEDIMDIPLDDPEANRAAAKIQAGFRGHMTRKKMKPEDKAEGEERQEDRGQ